jgi:uncharacterized Zn finger protein
MRYGSETVAKLKDPRWDLKCPNCGKGVNGVYVTRLAVIQCTCGEVFTVSTRFSGRVDRQLKLVISRATEFVQVGSWK